MIKRFNLNMPAELFDELQKLADERGVTPTDLLRQFAKLGLLIAKTEKDPNSQLILREGDQERIIVLLS